MFVTRCSDRFDLGGLAEPGADYWRSVGLATNSAFYVVTVRPPTKRDAYATLLIKSDSDLADSLDSTSVDLASLLLCVSPLAIGGTGDAWKSFSIREVWRGSDPSKRGDPCVIFVSDTGTEHSGLHGQAKVGLLKTRLLTRVTERGAANRASRK